MVSIREALRMANFLRKNNIIIREVKVYGGDNIFSVEHDDGSATIIAYHDKWYVKLAKESVKETRKMMRGRE